MYKGDISNEVSPRLVVVFEGLLGVLPNARVRAAESVARKARRWKKAVSLWEINELAGRAIWDVTMRKHQTVDVATYLGEEFAEALAERLDDENLPISKVWATEPHLLARELAYRPDLAAIYDPNPAHQFTYGGKGRILGPESANLFGAF